MASTDEKIFNGEDLETYSALVKQEILDVEDLLPLIVNFTENNDVVTSDTSIADIYAAYNAGRDVVGHVYQGQINLFICIENAVAFYWIYGNAVNYIFGSTNTSDHSDSWSHDIVYIQYELTFDSVPTANSENPVKSGGIKSAIDDVKTLVVNVTATGQYTGTIDKTPAEINSAYNEGKLVLYKTPPSLGARTFVLMRKFSSSFNTYYTAVSCDASVVATLNHMNDSTSVTLAFTDIAAGATAYQKPSTGIPKSDLEQSVQTSLDKADTALLQHQDLSSYADGAEYDSTNHFIYLKHGSTRLANPIDATDFIKDGMVDTVEVTGGNLVITFNTDSGKEDIEIPISDIFDASNYYTKSEVDTKTAKTTARSDSKLLYNGQSVEAVISNTGFSNTNNLLNNGYNMAIRSNSTNPFIGLKEGSNLWYALAAGNYFYFGPTSTKALRLDLNGNGVFQTGSVTATQIIKSGGTASLFLKADGSVDSNTYLTSFTETDPTVPSWAKQSTKPSYTASEVGALPSTTFIPSKTSDLTNDSGFITGYTETDPVYSASVAAGITSGDISNWNSKTSNIGTITGITMNGTSKGTSGVVNLGTVVTSETDPVFTASAAHGITASDITNWNNKLDSYTETDPTVPSWAKLSTKPSYNYSEINNTPTLATVATSGSYNDLSNKPIIPTVGTLNTNNSTALTVSSSESLSGAIKLHKVSKTGSYNDLTNKPTIPTVNNATLTIQKNGTNVATFTANASSNATANITVPVATSDLTNDSGFLGDADVSYDANTKTLIIGAVYEDIWYAKVQHYDEYTYEFLKENDSKWSVDNPYSTELGYCDSIYFTYKGENYYVTEIRDMVPAALSKTGNPVAVNLGHLNSAYITKDANDNFSVYFETD